MSTRPKMEHRRACSAALPEGHHRPQPYLSVRLHRQQVRVPYRWAPPSTSPCPNIMLNTAVAEELRQFADELEGAEDFEAALHTHSSSATIKAHKRIIFNGNGYRTSPGLRRRRSAACSTSRPRPMRCPHYVDQKNIDLFAKHNVFTADGDAIPVWRSSWRSTTRSCTSRR